MSDTTPENRHLFDDIFDEVMDNLGSEEPEPERPLFDSLSKVESAYRDFEEIGRG